MNREENSEAVEKALHELSDWLGSLKADLVDLMADQLKDDYNAIRGCNHELLNRLEELIRYLEKESHDG